MFKKFTLTAVALAAVACLGAGSASAATLYTSAAHTTPVAVGSTFTATMPAPYWKEYVSTQEVEPVSWCNGATISYKVTQNSAGVFKATSTAGALSTCINNTTMYLGWNLEISGGSTAVGSNTDWLGTTIKNVGFTWDKLATFTGSFKSATGSPPVKGIFTQQPTVAKAPVSLVLDHAPGISDPSFGQFTVSATLTFAGAAAAWSFG